MSRLEPPEQQQDQQDHDHKTKTAAAVVSSAVERSAADAAEAAQQGDHENDQNDCPDRHKLLLSPSGRFVCSALRTEQQCRVVKVPFFAAIMHAALPFGACATTWSWTTEGLLP